MWTINEKTFITLIALGVVTILLSIPLYLGRVKRNRIYGIRIRRAFESEQNWYRINRYGAGALILWAVNLMAVGTLCLFVDARFVLNIAKVGIISIIIPIMLTIAYGRRM
ncbi:MAG: SdpI family protein [Thermodesulfobacteriota bacterium]